MSGRFSSPTHNDLRTNRETLVDGNSEIPILFRLFDYTNALANTYKEPSEQRWKPALNLHKPVRIVETPPAPNPRRLRIFLAEKGVEIPRESIDIMQGDHRKPEYLAWAGAPAVPAMELEDGTVLTESIAICRYIEALHPEPNLMGKDPLEAATIEMWHRRVELGLWLHVAAVIRHLNPRMAVLEDQVPEWGESNRPRLDAAMRRLDERLAASPYIAGDHYTIADITAQVGLDFMRVSKTPVPEDCAALSNWLEKVRKRPSASA